MKKKFHIQNIGFWSDNYEDGVTPSFLCGAMDQTLRENIVGYLKTGTRCALCCGRARCRFECDLSITEELGSADYTDGHWLWPQGFSHYVERHKLLLPPQFIDYLQHINFEKPVIDSDLMANIYQGPECKEIELTKDSKVWQNWIKEMGEDEYLKNPTIVTKNVRRGNIDNTSISAKYEFQDYMRKIKASNNVDRAVKMLHQAVEAGDTDAMLLLGKLYFYGALIPREKNRGGKLIEMAVRQGNIQAERVLGDLIFKAGLHTHGLNWLETAAEHGDREAHYILGSIYLDGVHVEKDPHKVFVHLSTAAEAGYQPAFDILNMRFNYEGNHVNPRNELMVALNKLPDYFPEPCQIVFLSNQHIKLDTEIYSKSDSFLFGIKIKKTATLEKAEASVLSKALQYKHNYNFGGSVCFGENIAFIFGEGDEQVKVVVDLECGWTYIKFNKEFLKLGINWHSKCDLKYHEIAKDLRSKYFSNEIQEYNELPYSYI